MNEWNTREATRLVSLYAQSGRISRTQRVALERRIDEGDVKESLAALVQYDESGQANTGETGVRQSDAKL